MVRKSVWVVLLVVMLLAVTALTVQAAGPHPKPTDPNDLGGGGAGAAGIAIRLYTIYHVVDVTNPLTGKAISFSAYWDLVKYYYRGWEIVGRPFLKGGRWYLKIRKNVSY